MIQIPITRAVHEPFQVSLIVGSSASGGSAGSAAALTFSGLPPGAVVVSCRGFTSDASVPVLMSLVDQEVDARHVRLRWYTPERSVLSAIVCRRTVESDWTPLAVRGPDASGVIAFEDRDIRPGARYGYRLAIPAASTSDTTFAGETWVQVPAVPLALEVRPHANPIRGDLVADLRLISAGHFSVDVFDVAGRVVVHQDGIGSVGGDHTLTLATGMSLAPELYIIRLSQGGRSVTTKALIVR